MTQSLSLDSLAAVRIVLVAPAGPLNVGSVARVMKNFGLSQLVLVTPQCDPLGAEALQMAVHADDILRAARQVETIPEALAGCDRAIATTARTRGFNAPLQLPEIVLPTLLSLPSPPSLPLTPVTERSHSAIPVTERSRSALLFGPEDRGLSNEELIYAQAFTKIPTSDTYSALNLAQAVAICCYELYRASQPRQTPAASLQNIPPSAKQTESNQENLASLDELEGYYQHLETVLLKVEYLYPHTAASRMRKLRQLLHRTSPTVQEVALLRGMLRQIEWALSNVSNADRTS
ncbi:MAG: RNA methyltransferase [Cyanobacteria bacterium J06598_1]